jgi:hypothetical protein
MTKDFVSVVGWLKCKGTSSKLMHRLYGTGIVYLTASGVSSMLLRLNASLATAAFLGYWMAPSVHQSISPSAHQPISPLSPSLVSIGLAASAKPAPTRTRSPRPRGPRHDLPVCPAYLLLPTCLLMLGGSTLPTVQTYLPIVILYVLTR